MKCVFNDHYKIYKLERVISLFDSGQSYYLSYANDSVRVNKRFVYHDSSI